MKRISSVLISASMLFASVSVTSAHDKGSPPEQNSFVKESNSIVLEQYLVTAIDIQTMDIAFVECNAVACFKVTNIYFW